MRSLLIATRAQPPLAATRESPHAATKTQCSRKFKKKFLIIEKKKNPANRSGNLLSETQSAFLHFLMKQMNASHGGW